MKSDIHKKLAKRIIQLRKELGISSEKLAYGVGLSKTGVRYIERGLKDPKLSTLTLIAEGLGVSLSELFDFD